MQSGRASARVTAAVLPLGITLAGWFPRSGNPALPVGWPLLITAGCLAITGLLLVDAVRIERRVRRTRHARRSGDPHTRRGR